MTDGFYAIKFFLNKATYKKIAKSLKLQQQIKKFVQLSRTNETCILKIFVIS